MANILNDQDFSKYLDELEATRNLPTGALRAIAHQESGGNSAATSPKGAKGVFQFMPATATEYKVDVADPYSSATGAANYLRDLTKQYGGDFKAALAHYNGGNSQGQAVKAGGLPTYPETKDYVQRITSKMPSMNPGISREEIEAEIAAMRAEKNQQPNKSDSQGITREEIEAEIAAMRAEKNAQPQKQTAPDKSAMDYLTTSAKNFGEGAESFVRGVQKGATLGFNDEISGGIGAAIDFLTGKHKDLIEGYKANRDTARESDKAAFEKRPVSGFTGEMTGGILPAVMTGGGSSIPSMIGQGTAYGMGYGAGTSEADTAGGVALDAATGGAVGGVTGAVLPVLPAAGRVIANTGKAVVDSPVVRSVAKEFVPSVGKGLKEGVSEAFSWVNPSATGRGIKSTVDKKAFNKNFEGDLGEDRFAGVKPLIAYGTAMTGNPGTSAGVAGLAGLVKGGTQFAKGISSAYRAGAEEAAVTGTKPVWQKLLDELKVAGADSKKVAREMFTGQQTDQATRDAMADDLSKLSRNSKLRTNAGKLTAAEEEELALTGKTQSELELEDAAQEAARLSAARADAMRKAEEDRLATIRAKGAARDLKAAAEAAAKTDEPVTGPFAKLLSAIEQKKSGSVAKSADEVIAEGEARREAVRAERLARIRGEEVSEVTDEGTDLLSWANEGRAKAAADKAELDAAVKEMKKQPNPDANIDQVISMKKANVAKRLAKSTNPAERAALQKSLDELDEGINADIITTGTIDDAAQQRASDIMNAPMFIEELEQTLKTTTDPKVYKDTQKEIRRLQKLIGSDTLTSPTTSSMGLMTAGIRDKNPMSNILTAQMNLPDGMRQEARRRALEKLAGGATEPVESAASKAARDTFVEQQTGGKSPLNDPDTVERFGKGIDAARVEAGHLPGEQQRVYDILREEGPKPPKMTVQEKMDTYKNSPEQQAANAAKIKELGLEDQSYESVMEFLRQPMPARAPGVKVPESTSPPYDWSKSKESLDIFDQLRKSPDQIRQESRRMALEKLAANPTQVTESAADRAARHAEIVDDVKKYGPGGKEQAMIDLELAQKGYKTPGVEEVSAVLPEDEAARVSNTKLKKPTAEELALEDVNPIDAPAMEPQADELAAMANKNLPKSKVTEAHPSEVEHIDATGSKTEDLLLERFGNEHVPADLDKKIAELEAQKTGNAFRDKNLDKKIEWLIQEYKPKGE